MRQLYFLLCVLAGCTPLCVLAQNNPCDSIVIVAQATGGTMTCADPTVNLVGALHPSALSYQWTGPNGFLSSQRVAQTVRQGIYKLVVTGANGCTASTTVVVTDICTTANSAIIPPECPDGIVTPAESCDWACVFKCLDPSYMNQPYVGSTVGWGNDTGPNGWCGTIENDQWLAFMAIDPVLTLLATPSNCSNNDGLQMAIYESCNGLPLMCEGGSQNGGMNPVVLTVSGLIPGKAYYIVIDGYSGDQCDFTLETLPPSRLDILCAPSGSACPPGVDCFDFDTISITGPPSICPYGSAVYSINTPNNALISGYQWTGPSGTLIDGNPVPYITYPPNGKHPQITFGDQSGTLCVRTLTYFFPPSVPLCIDVGFNSPYETVLPDTVICHENVPYISPVGSYVYNTGNYLWTLSAANGCDSIIRQKVKVLLPIVRNITRNVCIGGCVDVCGVSYCTPGIYTAVCDSYLGCDSTTTLILNVLDPQAQIIGGGILSCTIPSLVLNSVVSPNTPYPSFRTWRNLQTGAIVGTGSSITVIQPGTYTLTTTMTGLGVLCTVADTIVIISNAVQPTALPVATPITSCTMPQATLSATSDLPAATFQWTGPGGFSAFGPIQTVPTAGTYTVRVTDPVSQCFSVASVVVEDQRIPPAVTATFANNNDCIHPQATLAPTPNSPNVIYNWIGPDNFSATGASQTVEITGVYSVTAISSITGCSNTASVTVAFSNIGLLTVNALNDTLDCYNPAVNLVATSNAAHPIYTWEEIGIGRAYAVVVTDSLTGCTATDTMYVSQNTSMPDLFSEGTVITCRTDSFTLTVLSNVPDLQYTWTGPNGFVSNEPSPLITEPGAYVVTVLDPVNGCTASITIPAVDDTAPPDLQLSQPIPSCGDSLLVLQATSNTVNVEISWTGPNGFTSTATSIIVSVAATYIAYAVGPNGCATMSSLSAVAAPPIPVVVTTGDTTNCQGAEAQLTATSSVVGATFVWTGPYNFTSTLANPQVDSVGTYFVIATTPANCTASATAIVVNGCIVDVATLNDGNGDLKVFPVPSSGLITLEIAPAWQSARMQITLVDAAGKEVWNNTLAQPSSRESFDLGQLPVGRYTIRIQTEGKIWHGLVVLSR